MDRRSLLGLALGLVPALAFAQAAAPGIAPPGTAPPGAAPPRAERSRITAMSFDEMTPRQRRKTQQRLAGAGNSPMPAEEARRTWDGMNPQQRREAARRPEGGSARRQPAARPAQ